MTNKLVVIINSLKVPKIKKILLYEMKCLVPNYSCLQNPRLGGYRPQIPVLSVLCPQLNLLNPPRTKFLGTPLLHNNCDSEMIHITLLYTCGWQSLDTNSDCLVRARNATTAIRQVQRHKQYAIPLQPILGDGSPSSVSCPWNFLVFHKCQPFFSPFPNYVSP